VAPPCVFIIVPVYNGAATAATLVARVLQELCVLEIIIVNDCSTDGSREIIQKFATVNPLIKLHRHDANSGKGATLRTGLVAIRLKLFLFKMLI